MTATAAGRRASARPRLSSALPPRGPGRSLYWSTLVNAGGTGLYLTTSSLYFVRVIGLSPARVGSGLAIAGLVGLLAGVPVGRLADSRGPREVYVATLTAEALAMGGLLFARSFLSFVALSAGTTLAASASTAARGPLVRAAGGPRPAELRSRLRSATNLGIGLSGPAAAAAISVNSRPAYAALIVANALSFALCALLMLRVPHVPATARGRAARRWDALADRPFIALTALNAVMMQQYPVLTLILPLWIALHTQVPHWVIGLAVPLNTAIVVLLQVRLSKGLESPPAAARAMARAGLILLAALALLGSLADLPAGLATLTLLAAIVIYTLGEIWSTASGYELSFALSRPAAQGEYLGLFSTGATAGKVASQLLATALCLVLGTPGWIILGVLLLGAGLATAPVTRWSLRAGTAGPVS